MTGTIATLNRAHGLGYIRPDDGGELVFFHRADVVGTAATFASMNEGDAVVFRWRAEDSLSRAMVTEWQPSGSIAQTLRRAANDIEQALAKLNMASSLDGTTRRWDNFQHAKVHQHLKGMPAKLRREASALTTKETLVQRDTQQDETPAQR